MLRKKRCLGRILLDLFILLAVCALTLAGCHTQQRPTDKQQTDPMGTQSQTAPSDLMVPAEKFEWTMYGYLVNSKGEVQETVELSLNGSIQRAENTADSYHIRFVYPQGYSFEAIGTVPTDNMEDYAQPYRITLGCGQKQGSADAEMLLILVAVDVVEERLIVDWNDGVDTYLVASTDNNASAKELMDHFQYFIDEHDFADYDVTIG